MKKGIPREVLDELDIGKKEVISSEFEVTAIVERHQVKLPLPSKLRRDIEFKRGQKLNVVFDPEKKTITYKF